MVPEECVMIAGSCTVSGAGCTCYSTVFLICVYETAICLQCFCFSNFYA